MFCGRIAAGEYELISNAYEVVRFEPLNPVTPGHMLFVPFRHVADAAEFPYLTGVTFAAASAFGFVQAEPFNLITSAGEAATQTVRHLHVHYVPRRAGDGLALPWTGQTKA